jgi:two-component system, response regulator YesN
MTQTMMRVQILLASPEELRQWFDSAVDELINLFDTSASQDDTHLQKILCYIDLNDFSSISLENAAELVGLTPQYISKLFKQKFSINFLDYVIHRRIESACKLLKSTNLTVKDVAARSGYTDVGYFSKAFRKMTGLTPRQYRLQVR